MTVPGFGQISHRVNFIERLLLYIGNLGIAESSVNQTLKKTDVSKPHILSCGHSAWQDCDCAQKEV